MEQTGELMYKNRMAAEASYTPWQTAVRRRERISWTFRPNRLLTRAARHAHLTEPGPEGTPYSRFGEQGSGCVLRNIWSAYSFAASN